MSGYFPACPQCGELCGKLARICSECGAFLYDPSLNDRISRDRLHPHTADYRSLPRDAAGRWLPGEDSSPRKGTEA